MLDELEIRYPLANPEAGSIETVVQSEERESSPFGSRSDRSGLRVVVVDLVPKERLATFLKTRVRHARIRVGLRFRNDAIPSSSHREQDHLISVSSLREQRARHAADNRAQPRIDNDVLAHDPVGPTAWSIQENILQDAGRLEHDSRLLPSYELDEMRHRSRVKPIGFAQSSPRIRLESEVVEPCDPSPSQVEQQG